MPFALRYVMGHKDMVVFDKHKDLQKYGLHTI